MAIADDYVLSAAGERRGRWDDRFIRQEMQPALCRENASTLAHQHAGFVDQVAAVLALHHHGHQNGRIAE